VKQIVAQASRAASKAAGKRQHLEQQAKQLVVKCSKWRSWQTAERKAAGSKEQHVVKQLACKAACKAAGSKEQQVKRASKAASEAAS
jgi:hypothetical protein